MQKFAQKTPPNHLNQRYQSESAAHRVAFKLLARAWIRRIRREWKSESQRCKKWVVVKCENSKNTLHAMPSGTHLASFLCDVWITWYSLSSGRAARDRLMA